MDDQRFGIVDNWLRHIQDIKRKHSNELSALSKAEQANRLTEINVAEQVLSLAQTTIVQDAWVRGQSLAIHGLVYNVADGILKELDITLTQEHAKASLDGSLQLTF
jgi:carbonic anhydrase